jgi:hypothetical protein
MYLIEWGLWKIATENQKDRAAADSENSKKRKRADDKIYESDLDSEIHFNTASEFPYTRGPIFSLNETYLETRCGGSEEKRGIITLITLGGVCPTLYTGTLLGVGFAYQDITAPHLSDAISISITLFMLAITTAIYYFYFKYGFQITRLEIFTSRHLLIRFNRKTQQVHIHRPKNCGGIVTFPWHATGSTAILPEDDWLSTGMRLALVWHPSRTGLPHLETAFIGKQGQGGSELRDEWEFIRRYMEEGPDTLPRPKLSTQLPSPIQAFSAQFEGLGRFIRKSSWLLKIALLFVWPAFIIIGTAHWVSLMLCWRPRWPKIIREAGMPGKPVPPLTTLADYPPEIQERLLANADRWKLIPGKRPDKKPRKRRAAKTAKVTD